jgi:hypothetical protein
MFKTYLKIAWRNIWRNKGFSITNLSGLTIGMTCTILILLWVHDELNWDKFHSNHKNIYQVLVNRNFNGEITTDKSAPFPLAAAIKSNFPEIKHSTVDDYGSDNVLKYNETIIKRRGITATPDYAKLFQWKFVKGNAATALINPENIVLTQSTAKAFCGAAGSSFQFYNPVQHDRALRCFKRFCKTGKHRLGQLFYRNFCGGATRN